MESHREGFLELGFESQKSDSVHTLKPLPRLNPCWVSSSAWLSLPPVLHVVSLSSPWITMSCPDTPRASAVLSGLPGQPSCLPFQALEAKQSVGPSIPSCVVWFPFSSFEMFLLSTPAFINVSFPLNAYSGCFLLVYLSFFKKTVVVFYAAKVFYKNWSHFLN